MQYLFFAPVRLFELIRRFVSACFRFYTGLVTVVCLMLSGPAMAGTGDARQPGCTLSMAQARLAVELNVPETKYITRLNAQAIARISGGGIHKSIPGWRQAGLTSAREAAAIKLTTRSSPVVGQGFCTVIEQLDVTIGYDSMEVYIASEYAEGSCEYRVIKSHELNHVLINLSTLKNFRQDVERELKTYVAQLSPMINDNPEQVIERLKTVLYDRLKLILRPMAVARFKAHMEIDSRSSYRRAQSRCQGW